MSSSRKRATRETIVHHSAPTDQQQYPPSFNSYTPRSMTGSSLETSLNPHQPQRRLTVRIKRFHAVAQWSWNAGDPGDVCSICQNAYESTAPGIKYPGEDCPVVFGKCRHAFHLQCVSKWLNQVSSKNTCPICRQDWEFSSAGGGNPPPAPENNDNAAAAGNEQEDEVMEIN